MAGTCDGHSFLSGAKAASSSSSAWRTWAMAAARSANAPFGVAPVGGSVTKLRRPQASAQLGMDLRPGSVQYVPPHGGYILPIQYLSAHSRWNDSN